MAASLGLGASSEGAVSAGRPCWGFIIQHRSLNPQITAAGGSVPVPTPGAGYFQYNWLNQRPKQHFLERWCLYFGEFLTRLQPSSGSICPYMRLSGSSWISIAPPALARDTGVFPRHS